MDDPLVTRLEQRIAQLAQRTGERRALVQAEFGDCTPPGGMTSEQFVAAADRVISELWCGDPAETFDEAGRLIEGGADRHEAIHTLAAR